MLSQFLKGYSLAQLNSIPQGHNNNLIWNIAHIIVVQQMLVYKLSGLPMKISDTLVEKYKKGTKPEQDATQAEVDEIIIYLWKRLIKRRLILITILLLTIKNTQLQQGLFLPKMLYSIVFMKGYILELF
jgi:hypothetical protein